MINYSHKAKLKNVINGIEDAHLTRRSKTASDKLAGMNEEERKMLLMWPEEKKFFLRYKEQHQENPWSYYKEYSKTISNAYNKNGELPQL